MTPTGPNNGQGIYAVLERLLKATDERNPLTCTDLFDDPEVKKYADSPNRVSDYVAHMWRRGLLQRWTAPRNLNNKARFAYTWKGATTVEPLPDKSSGKVSQMPDLKILKNPLSKPNITVTEGDNEIVLDFADFTLTIRSKKNEGDD